MVEATTRHLVDPRLLPALDLMPSWELNAGTLAAARERARDLHFAAADAPSPLGVERTEVAVPGPAGAPDVRVLVYQPTDAPAPKPAVLHIHGGGYVLGAPEMNDLSNRTLASEIGCVVVSVDYRLAPEAPFPGGVEDCYAALVWMWRNAEDLGIDRLRMAVLGESAGGGLAAALSLLARDRGEVKLAYQQLSAPMLDDRTASRAHNPFGGEFVWTPAANRFGWASLLGAEPGGEGVSPYAAAARAETVAGLPATFIRVGALDILVDENIEFARRLLREGIPVELQVTPGAFHGFEVGAAIGAAPAVEALASGREALRRALS